MKKVFLLVMMLTAMMLFSGCPKPAECGNSICEGTENKCTCSDDCGECTGNAPGECREYRCIDGICRAIVKENCCGNQICEDDETQENCSEDCERIVTEPDEFGFGIEYVLSDEGASFYSSLGTKWARMNYVLWNLIEPNAPVAEVHNYDFSLIDETVLAWQQSGIENFHIRIHVNAAWAVDDSGCFLQAGKSNKSSPLVPGYEQDFYDFVYNLVERYDKDDERDMPGLLYPVNYFEVMSEAQHSGEFCVSHNLRLQEYEKILKIAYTATKDANPNAKIILSGITMEEIFQEFPSKEEVDARIECWLYKPQYDFIKQSLQLTDYYDIIEFHSLVGDPLEPYGFIRWVRDQGIDKPVWVGDAFSIQIMTPIENNCVPVMYPNGSEIFASVDRVMMERYGGVAPTQVDKEVEKWYRKEQASQVVKKAVVTADAGYEVIMIGNTIDWYPWRSVGNHFQDAAWMGLVQVNDATLGLDSGLEIEYARPAFYAYQQLIGKVDGFDEVEKIDLEDGVYLYKFTVDEKDKFVLWYEDSINECPYHCESEIEGSTTVDLSPYVSTTNVKITHIITELNESKEPIYKDDEIVPADSVSIGEDPVFIEEA